MKRTAQTFLSVFVFASTMFGATQRYTVVTRTAVGPAHAARMMRELDATATPETRRVSSFRVINGFAADLTPQEAAALKKDADVAYVAPSVERHALEIGGAKESLNDAANPFQQVVPYGIDLVRAREVWPVTRGQGINVVIVDTGIDYTHPELAAIYAGGHNEITGSDDPKDDNGHGTHVAGTIAAADNNIGVLGIAPNVKLWSVKVLDSSGSGSSSDVIASLDWILQQKQAKGGDWVVNFSLGSSRPDPAERQAFANAVAGGLLICAASGNDSTAATPAPVGYPAAYDGVMAIGAIDATKTIATFSNQGTTLGVVAPGVNVLSTVPVGSGSIAGVQTAGGNYSAAEVQYSARGTVTGAFVNCGVGQPSDFPANVAGKIAVIQRGPQGGTLGFNAKAHNALNAGAIGVVIYNDSRTDMNWTLASDSDPTASTFNWPVVIGVSHNDGLAILSSSGPITIQDSASDYETLSGTSMATPHATGVAALVWSAAPQLSASDLIKALEQGADDLGDAGFDSVYGNGLIDALTAAKAVAPEKFGLPATPPTTKKSHAVRHH